MALESAMHHRHHGVLIAPSIPGTYSNFRFSIGLMVGSMVITFAFFKRRGWL